MSAPDDAMRLADEFSEVMNLLALVAFTRRGRVKQCLQAMGIPEFPGGWQQYFEFSERTEDRPELQKLVALLVPILLPELRARVGVRNPRRELAALLQNFSESDSAIDLAINSLRTDLMRIGETGSLDELGPAARACLNALDYRLDAAR